MANDVARMILKFSESSNVEHLKKSYKDKHYKFFNELKYLLFDKIYNKTKENDYIEIDTINGIIVESLSGLSMCSYMGTARKTVNLKYRAKTDHYSETEEENTATLAFFDETYMTVFFNFIKAHDLRLLCTFKKYSYVLCMSWEHWKLEAEDK